MRRTKPYSTRAAWLAIGAAFLELAEAIRADKHTPVYHIAMWLSKPPADDPDAFRVPVTEGICSAAYGANRGVLARETAQQIAQTAMAGAEERDPNYYYYDFLAPCPFQTKGWVRKRGGSELVTFTRKEHIKAAELRAMYCFLMAEAGKSAIPVTTD